MKITALLENTTEREDIQAEHGLSLFIRANGKNVLFDMGQTDLFSKNAKTLNIDLKSVDFAVLSHGHYDHGGGLKTFLQINKTAKVYINEHAFEPHYNGERYIGLDMELLEYRDRIVFTSDEYEICDGFKLYSCNDRERPQYLGSFGLNKEENGELVSDDFIHEQYLLIEENEKRVLISGCSHKGVLDIEDWFEPDYLIGGFHYSKLELDESLIDYAKRLDAHHTKYYTCHCTGKAQADFMEKYMHRLEYLSCARTIEI